MGNNKKGMQHKKLKPVTFLIPSLVSRAQHQMENKSSHLLDNNTSPCKVCDDPYCPQTAQYYAYMKCSEWVNKLPNNTFTSSTTAPHSRVQDDNSKNHHDTTKHTDDNQTRSVNHCCRECCNLGCWT